MADDPLDFSADETREREARLKQRRKEAETAPLPGRFITNRQLCLCLSLFCLVPALAFIVVPGATLLASGTRPWPMTVLDGMDKLIKVLLYLPGLLSVFGVLLNLLAAFSTSGTRDTDRQDGSGNPIWELVTYHCPACRCRWRWHALPAFYATYRCPQCARVSAVTEPGHSIFTLASGIGAAVGYVELLVLIIVA